MTDSGQTESGTELDGAQIEPQSDVSLSGSDELSSEDTASKIEAVEKKLNSFVSEVRGLQSALDKNVYRTDERLAELERNERERYYQLRTQGGMSHEQAERELAIDRMLQSNQATDGQGTAGTSKPTPNFNATELYEVAGLDPNEDPEFTELIKKGTSDKDFAKHVIERIKLKSRSVNQAQGAPLSPGAPPKVEAPKTGNEKNWADYKREVAAATTKEQRYRIRAKYRTMGIWNPETGQLL